VAGRRFFREVKLSPRRHYHHVRLPRLPRTSRGAKRTERAPCGHQKRAIKHALPLAKGGVHAPGNLVAACGRCNRLKGDLLPTEFFARYPSAGLNFIHYARAVHRALKRCARRAVSLAYARAA